jgi:hypothetical protein
VAQVNAIPNRPMQSPRDVKHILWVLRWTTLPTGETQRRKGWNITYRPVPPHVPPYTTLCHYPFTLCATRTILSRTGPEINIILFFPHLCPASDPRLCYAPRPLATSPGSRLTFW